jgi:protease-4
VATAADKIIAPRPAMWDVAGLRSELTFLKDSLAILGVQAEVVNVSPYKTAWDTFARSEISSEHQAMIEWAMDGRFDTLVEAIAKARKLDTAQVREFIDQAPLTAIAAREQGLLDAVLYEDEIAEYLAPANKEEKKKPARWWPFGKKEVAEEKPEKPKANIKRWGAVAESLRRPLRWRSGKRVAIISIEGTIIPGRSPQTPPIPNLPIPIPIPFIDEPMAGSETVGQHLRDAEKDDSIAAIVLSVNSRGGSALASDLIWREVDRVRRKKPIVVYMGDFAASGGYFVSASANHIIAQPLTMTGSIGVITLKIVTSGLYEKLKANRVVIQRGAQAGLYADDAPFTPELRAAAQAQTDAYYADFKNVVTSGRHIEDSNFEDIAGGRVWLGVQALERKLVDELGDLQVAIDKAKELAKLPSDRYTPNVWYSGGGSNLFPPPFPSALDNIAEYANLMRTVFRERVWMMIPFNIKG